MRGKEFMGSQLDLFSNKEIENTILANIIQDAKLIAKLNEYDSEVFYNSTNKVIFEMLRSIYNKHKNIDMVLIGDYVIKNKPTDFTITDITTIVSGGAFASAIDEYIGILIDLYNKRVLRRAVNTIDFSKDTEELKSNVLGTLNKMSITKEEEKTEDLVFDTLETILSGVVPKGISTGIREIDYNLMGLNKGELITIAARSGVGKTTLALNIFTHQAYVGYKPHYFSLEMPKEELIKKMLSIKSGIASRKIRTNSLEDKEEAIVTSLANGLASKNFKVYDKTSSVDHIENIIREEHLKGNLDIAYIDLINRVTTKEKVGSRAEYIGSITRRFKQLALELKIPVVILAQINRGAEQRTDRRPMLSDLKESGSIEEDSDVVISVYRNLVVCDRNFDGQADYNSNDPDKNPDRCELHFLKSRYTGNAIIPMVYNGSVGVIKDLMR